MFHLLARHWWVVVLRGLVAIGFGVLAFSRPEMTLGVLVTLFAIYAMVDGVFAMIAAFQGSNERHRHWVLFVEGIFGILAGAVALAWPGMTTVALVYVIGVWAVATGLLEVMTAIALRKEITGEFWLVLSGILSVIFGCLVFARPGQGALAMVWILGWYAVIFGISFVFLGLRFRSWGRRNDLV